MKVFLLVTLALGVLAGLASAQTGMAGGGTKKESPFACDRRALNPEQRKRHFDELGPMLRNLKKRGARELADGYEFEFPADFKTVELVAEWAAGERLCCPFFDIEMRLERGGGPLWLRLTGRKGTKDLIRADGALWVQP